jgi:sugar (pentulose or hexulose) kinase
MKKVIAIFDIGKTNKKFLLFDENHELVFQDEKVMPTTVDDDGFECDDLDLIEKWVISRIEEEFEKGIYDIRGVNFSTYGASLVFIDGKGKRLTPVYNYLKPIPEQVAAEWYANNGGKEEFCRKTASPALGLMLNSGVQILWFKKCKSEIFNKTKHILHFPQYLSYLFSKHILTEYTSIGCHTGMWDFDNMEYHEWLKNEGISLPHPMGNSYKILSQIQGKDIYVGTGIHDSSASLATYLLADVDRFILISTGTWCINMNPFNHQPLTQQELEKDCLCYLSIDEKPVKSSRFFMGHIHDVNLAGLVEHFGVTKDEFKKVKPDEELLKSFLNDSSGNQPMFFKGGVPEKFFDDSVDLNEFKNFEEAYQRLIFDLTRLNALSVELVSARNDGVKNIFISGGFARNQIFVKLMTAFFPDKKIYTSQVDNSSALGAALVIEDIFEKSNKADIDLNLKEWDSL